MAERKVEGFEEVNSNIKKPKTVSLDKNTVGAGTVPAAVSGTVSAAEYGDGVFHKTVLTLTAVPVTMRDVEQGGGVQIYDFPVGYIQRLGASGTIAVTTTSVLADTLNTGVTCNWGVGSVTQANATVATTEQDFVNVTAFTASATIDVAGADATGVGVGVLAALDGTSTAVDAFLNLAVAGATDIDADATVTVSGTINIAWMNLS
jgi:hypothetical protein